MAKSRVASVSKNKYIIVLVEDDQMLLKYLSARLKKEEGFEVHTATDGEAGEKLIREKKPDFVLLDVIMPRKNGFEVLRAIKTDPKTSDIPIVILSNLGQSKDAGEAKKLGATD